ncbi:MAG TPA: SUMF1/EgtB/PvdO family nonheme iron enzyme [Candidatus Saccharimonadia bacterium]|nr:SUMF1/EgtB/PvdO family nonheme iron enzyme [Candidatus Saccharimonadia bacterium]
MLDSSGLIATPWSPFRNPGSTSVRALSARFAVPQGYISGAQAAIACENAGKRLCSDSEWLRACRGPSNTTFPYGNTRMPGVCNDARATHPAVEYFGSSDPSVFSQLAHPCLNQLEASLDRAGTNAACVSAEGVHDLMGNLHEWTADPAGTFRGGYYVDTATNGSGCLYATTAHDTGHFDFGTGFRCCANP